jgi:hypothetical protein
MARRRRQVVWLGAPALIVGALAMLALWRVGAPADDPAAVVGTTGTTTASLEDVRVGEVTSARTFWIATSDDDRAFAVLDPDVDRSAGPVAIHPGARVTLIGMVRPAPPVARAMSQWRIDEGTARSLAARGTYLHVTAIRPPE